MFKKWVFSVPAWKGSPSLQIRAPAKTAPSNRPFTALTATPTAAALAAPPRRPGTPRLWPSPIQPAWPGCSEHGTSQRVSPSASKRKRSTSDARLSPTATSSQQTCRIRRYFAAVAVSWFWFLVPGAAHPPHAWFCFYSPGGDAGEKVWRLLRKPQGRPDHSDSFPTVSHEQEL